MKKKESKLGDIILKGMVLNNSVKEYQEIYFTENELQLALQVAEKWDERGYKPLLYHRTYDGEFKALYGSFYKESKKKAVKKTPVKKNIKKTA
jgi:hypothetical protein